MIAFDLGSGPFLLSYSMFDLILFFFRFWAVRQIKLAISSAFERTLIYRIVSYRIFGMLLHVDIIHIKFDGQGHKSRFKVTREEKYCKGATSSEYFLVIYLYDLDVTHTSYIHTWWHIAPKYLTDSSSTATTVDCDQLRSPSNSAVRGGKAFSVAGSRA